MSSIKIRDLVEKTDYLYDEDLMVIEDSEDTKKIPLIKLKSSFSMDSSLIAIKDSLSGKLDQFTHNHEISLSDLEHKIKQISIMCANLDNDHIHDSERIFELEDRLIVESDGADSLLFEKNRLLKLILELQTEKDALSEEISELKATIEQNKKLISELQDRLTAINNDMENIEDTNVNLDENIKDLESKASTTIDSNYKEVNDRLNSNIDKLMEYIRYYHPDVDDIFGLEG